MSYDEGVGSEMSGSNQDKVGIPGTEGGSVSLPEIQGASRGHHRYTCQCLPLLTACAPKDAVKGRRFLHRGLPKRTYCPDHSARM